uniref:Uncharacterized protein n=1 Tax=Ditylenchus dipsaci TaxID=166011 RepID=A0A915EN07_9BILA
MEPTDATFRKPKKLRHPRSRGNEVTIGQADGDEEGTEDEVEAKISDIREAQKSRERRSGMTAVECAVGKEMAREFNELDEDPFRMKGGGMLRLSDDRKAALAAADIENDIKEQFKKETLLRDENEEMRNYIDSRLHKNDGTDQESTEPSSKKFKAGAGIEESILFRAAEKVKGYASKSNDELLSNQMLVGIPEVDLGIDVRMDNIVATEKKKIELMQKRRYPSQNNFDVVFVWFLLQSQ